MKTGGAEGGLDGKRRGAQREWEENGRVRCGGKKHPRHVMCLYEIIEGIVFKRRAGGGC